MTVENMSGPAVPGETAGETAARDVAGLPPAPEVIQLEVGLLQNFCEILHCPETGEAAVVDPAWEVDRLLRAADDAGARITQILITHTHIDHVEGVSELARRTGARVVVSPREAEALSAYGGVMDELASARAAANATAPVLVDAVDRLDVAIGRRGVRVLDTPGHTTGGTCYLADGFIITGDVLFVGGCGRTDFPGGDTAALWRSLQRLIALPEETRVYPGHDYGPTPTATLAHELRENPYLRCQTFEQFHALRERYQAR